MGQHALDEAGISSRHTPSIQMEVADHTTTRNHSGNFNHEKFREVEKVRARKAADAAANGDMSLWEDMVLDEAADIEARFPGKYDSALNEALDYFIENGDLAFRPKR
ncbi:hypothetical protein [Corynebacterium cystitidis]|uniref:hypothetical protein n=1 Tax=Corynebacterium cystitidis TaxID=35757 RepID=UPI00211EFE57|nr:hypothetical protein [Corynebacterium cystitidis]